MTFINKYSKIYTNYILINLDMGNLDKWTRKIILDEWILLETWKPTEWDDETTQRIQKIIVDTESRVKALMGNL